MPDTITDSTASSEPIRAVRCVFVYGTLRRGEQRDINSLLPAPIFRGYAQVPGVLYHLGRYPGMRRGGPCVVHGEVYQIEPALERQLDQIEEVWPQQTGEYSRQTVCVAFTGTSVSGLGQTCLIYEIAAPRAAGMPVIASGDWLNRSI